jgi:hypothetical protein
MRRTPLKRKTALKRGVLRHRGLLKRRKRLSPMSRLRRVESRVYSEKRKAFLFDHPMCEFGQCFARSEDVHHRHGRNGKNYLDTSTWTGICRKHHEWIHQHPNQARAMGLLAPVNGSG